MTPINKLFILFLVVSNSLSAQIYQWRGADRSGIYPDKNLMNEWPADGPELVKTIEGIGLGYGSPTPTPTHIYIAGMVDTIGYIYCFDRDGKKIWEKAYGNEYTNRYLGSRGTPTIEGERLYYSGSFGDVICLNIKDGSTIWHINTFDLFGGKAIKWGHTESVLLYDDLLICTPGGDKHNIVALNKTNGELVWNIDHSGATNAYCSPALIRHNNKDLVMLNTTKAIMLFEPKTGEVYVQHPLTDSRNNHTMPPLYKDGQLFYASGYGEGSVMFDINDDMQKLDTLWQNKDFDCKMSGIIEHKGQTYGTADRKKQWMSISWESGETLFTSREIKPGSFVMADEKFYLYSEIGEVALAEPIDSGFVIKHAFKVPKENMTMAFAHPVIFEAELYLRFDNYLWVYDIKD
jgi:outer membrane protein assembly factor BamB